MTSLRHPLSDRNCREVLRGRMQAPAARYLRVPLVGGSKALQQRSPDQARTRRVLSVVTDRLFRTKTAGVSTMPLTSTVRVSSLRSSRAQDPSEHTFAPPSDCPTNRDHLTPLPICLYLD